ncbi:MAG TPA: response regulator transcription factor [Solirubrobacteraceae bacterium]|nr:response regulator transcription factor [Solirubrobacteraceae bacterium]
MGLSVLIAEDDARLRAMLRRGLGYAGYALLEAEDGETALSLGLAARPDLVILDVGLPRMDGLAVCRALRADSGVPILMLTARGEIADRVTGLREGADDYLVKPFAFQELVARLEALARRQGLSVSEVLRAGELELHADTGEVRRGGRLIELRPRERELLELLMRHPGQVLSPGVIWQRLWGADLSGQSNALNVALSGLRRKLGDPPLVETVRGVGYRVAAPAR